MTAFLTIVRDSGYADPLRAYRVFVDGKEIGKVGNGETKTFPVNPGAHRLALKIDWCGSKAVEFTAADGASMSFQVRSNLRGARILAALWYALFAWNSWLLLERTTSDRDVAS